MAFRKSRLLTFAVVALAAASYVLLAEQSAPPGGSAPAGSVPTEARAALSEDAAVERAFQERRSDLWLELGGVVEKTLSDDLDGSRHQRFVVRLGSGRTLLVAHNIDLASRVPLRRGDTVRLRGEYEWNERGGVVHWTHHDPRGRRPGGWIEHEGQRYR